MNVARRLFVERGFHSTGVAQIAAESGIKVGQIYRDFQSKEDVIAAIAAADLAAFLDEDVLRASIAAGDREAVRAWIGRFLQVNDPIEQCRMMTEIVAEAARNARIAEIRTAIDRRLHGLLVQALTVLAPDARSEQARAGLSDLILTLSIGMINRRIADPSLDLSGLEAQLNGIVDREIAQLIAEDSDVTGA